MRSRMGFILGVIFVMLSVNAYSTGGKEKTKGAKETVVFSVPMHCKTCQGKVERSMSFEKGVTNLKTDLPTNTVYVTFKSDKNTVEGLIAAFKKIGFEAKVKNP